MKYTLRCPSCTGCPHDLYFGEAIPKKQFSVMMHCGEHFCTGGKKARRFKRSDPKIASGAQNGKVPVNCGSMP